MAVFTRSLDSKIIDALKNEKLFTERLKPDIEAGKVFLAIRPGRCSFYYKGRYLFAYDGKAFSAYSKFAFVPEGKETYGTEAQLSAMNPEKDFCKAYPKIIERAALYADTEAEGISGLYKFTPIAKNNNKHFFIVDIEVVFNSDADNPDNKKKSKTGRIDILLYDNIKKQLLFCEAKHFSNPEIWPGPGDKDPKVISQLNGYNEQISNKRDSILKEYAVAFCMYSQLFGVKLNDPEIVCNKCGLLIFGYNKQQQDDVKELRTRIGLKGHKCRIIGHASGSSFTVESLFNALI